MYTIMNRKFCTFENDVRYYIVEICVDSESDIPEPKADWKQGSACLIVDTQDVKFLNSAGEWV